MRAALCHFVILSMLFMGMDGAADMASEGHPHSDQVAHQFDTSNPGSPDTESDTDSGQDVDHCEQCCHGHTASVIAQFPLLAPTTGTGDHLCLLTRHVVNDAQAPPTPPPNA